jgi:hypothetical protein
MSCKKDKICLMALMNLNPVSLSFYSVILDSVFLI